MAMTSTESQKSKGTFIKKENESWGEFTLSMIVAILVALLIRTFLLQPFVIPSGSMKPNLMIGDFLFVSKYSYGYTKHSFPFSLPVFEGRIMGSEPQIGDIVIFKGPYDPDTDYIKRLVGKPGDRIQMKEGILHINDVPCPVAPDGEYIDDRWEGQGSDETERPMPRYVETLPNGVKHYIVKRDRFGAGMLDNTQEYVVPEGHYFMVGDNRDESGDSRVLKQIGYVPQDNVIGQAQFIWLSSSAKWWEVWNWPLSIRFKRLFKQIN